MNPAASELIVNPDGSVYHLNLRPGDLAETIITVGDPDRVGRVSRHFDSVEITRGKREFLTHTGYIGNHRISVLSTGIGTDNIDIVLNEIDALFHFDFTERYLKKERTSLKIIRIGTTGALHPENEIDSFICSTQAIGFDNLAQFYDSQPVRNRSMEDALTSYLKWPQGHSTPYCVSSDGKLADLFTSNGMYPGCTATNAGFYGPQGRQLRLAPTYAMNALLPGFSHNNVKITNLEMETSGIYLLSKLLQHQAVSLNAVIAQRGSGKFSEDPSGTVDKLIDKTLRILFK